MVVVVVVVVVAEVDVVVVVAEWFTFSLYERKMSCPSLIKQMPDLSIIYLTSRDQVLMTGILEGDHCSVTACDISK